MKTLPYLVKTYLKNIVDLINIQSVGRSSCLKYCSSVKKVLEGRRQMYLLNNIMVNKEGVLVRRGMVKW